MAEQSEKDLVRKSIARHGDQAAQPGSDGDRNEQPCDYKEEADQDSDGRNEQPSGRIVQGDGQPVTP